MSGGQLNVVAGSAAIAELVRLAGERIEIAVGGGLRLQNAESLARGTHAKHFHGSLRRELKQPAAAEGAVDSMPVRFRYAVGAAAVSGYHPPSREGLRQVSSTRINGKSVWRGLKYKGTSASSSR